MTMAAAASKQGIILGRLWKALLLSRSKRLKENKKLMKIGLDVGTLVPGTRGGSKVCIWYSGRKKMGLVPGIRGGIGFGTGTRGKK